MFKCLNNNLQEPTRDPDVWPAPAPKDPQVSHWISVSMCLNMQQLPTVVSLFHFRCGILQRILLKQTLVGLVGEFVPSGGRGKAPGDMRCLRSKPGTFAAFTSWNNFLLLQRFWTSTGRSRQKCQGWRPAQQVEQPTNSFFV